MLGGNHCHLVLKLDVDKLKQQLEKARSKVKGKGVQAYKHSDITGPIGDKFHMQEKKVKWLENKLLLS
jgi:hypothetical protein